MNHSLNISHQVSPVIVHLLKGVLYDDQRPELWRDLLNFQGAVRDYFAVMGLEVYVDENEGYAFLKQLPEPEKEGNQADNPPIPRLIQRRQLGFPISLLCVLLRKKMAESDAAGGETRVILTRDQIIDMMRVFLPSRENEAKTVDQVDQTINKVVDYGLLRRFNKDEPIFELHRIIKAMIDADWLANMDEKLNEYKKYGKSAT